MNLILILICLLLFSDCNAQIRSVDPKMELKDSFFLNNSTVKYSIVLAPCQNCFPIYNRGYRVFVELSKSEKALFRTIPRERWLLLLQDEQRDWAANLLLHDLYDKPAHLLIDSNRERWSIYARKLDLEFWSQTLK
jgi:hypothetical protein